VTLLLPRSSSNSPSLMFFRRMLEGRGVRSCFILLALLYLAALFSGFVAPQSAIRPDDHLPYHPPNVSFIDSMGRLRWWPVVRSAVTRTDASGRRIWEWKRESDRPLRLLVEGDSYRWSLPWIAFSEGMPRLCWRTTHSKLHLFGADPGPDGSCPSFLLGSDHRGRDLFSRVLHGARISLSIGIVGVLISFGIGLVVGGVSGYFGGLIDDAIQRLCELLMLLPGFYVLLALRGALPDTSKWSSTRIYVTVVVIVSSIYWAGLARSIRGQVLALKTQDYVAAARNLGAGPARVIVRHLLPNTASFAIVAATVSIPGYILMESALSMLGLGIQEPEPSWGNMLADAMRVSQLAEHPWILLPGVFLCLAVIAFNGIGDALRDALDPR